MNRRANHLAEREGFALMGPLDRQPGIYFTLDRKVEDTPCIPQAGGLPSPVDREQKDQTRKEEKDRRMPRMQAERPESSGNSLSLLLLLPFAVRTLRFSRIPQAGQRKPERPERRVEALTFPLRKSW